MLDFLSFIEIGDIVDDIFIFASSARTAFNKGNNQSKREILNALGTGHLLLNGELFIEAHPWLKPIEDGYPRIEVEALLGRTADTVKIGLHEAKKGELEQIIKTWYRWSDLNRHDLAIEGF